GSYMLIDPSKGDARTPLQVGTDGRPNDMIASRSYIAWQRVGGGSLQVAPWVIRAYDRRSRQTVTVARSHQISGHKPPPVPKFTGVTVAGRHLAWARVDSWPKSRAKPVVNIYGVDLRTGDEPRLLARDAMMPVATAKGVVYARTHYVHPGTPKDVFTIHRVGWRGGQDTVLFRGHFPARRVLGGLAAHGHRVAWITAGNPDALTLLDLSTGKRQVFTDVRKGCFGYPILTDIFLTWSDGNCSGAVKRVGYVYIFSSDRLRSVGNSPGLYPTRANGRLLDWTFSHSGTGNEQSLRDRVVEILPRSS
ncbi:MAG: hypothetical protein ACRDQA_22760, partial [Nocardioidaceae bacterium]